jgi:hypothetical protein
MPAERRFSWLLLLANATLAYPFLSAGLLYGCWIYAGQVLGHAPVAWLDDPGDTIGGYLYNFVSWVAIVPIPFAFFGCLIFNVNYVLKARSSAAQAGFRALTAAAIWLWFWSWVIRDPGEIHKWWMD